MLASVPASCADQLDRRWFSVNMGTGIVSILLFEMPYNARWLYWLSVVVFALNVFLFVIFLILSLLRYILYPRLWRAMLRHPTQSLFLGTFPMGFATLVSMVVLVCVPAWGSWAITLAWTMWWIDTIISVTVCFYLPFVMCDPPSSAPVVYRLTDLLQHVHTRHQTEHHDGGLASSHCQHHRRRCHRSCCGPGAQRPSVSTVDPDM